MRQRLFFLVTLLALAAGDHALSAQPLDYGLTLSAAGSQEEALPFWLHAGRYGTVDQTASNFTARLFAAKPFAPTQPFTPAQPFVPARRFDYSLGVEVIAREAGAQTAYVHQLYGRVRFQRLSLTAGRIEETEGIIPAPLSLGTMTWGRNATPIPRLTVELDWVPIIRFPDDDLLYMRGHFSHGWLEQDRFVEGALIHSKSAYFGFHFPGLPAFGFGGISHHAVWGGTHPEFGPLPERFSDYLRVVLGRSGDPANATPGDVAETLGNNVAYYKFGLLLQGFGWEAVGHRQFYLETSAGLRFRNAWDGLWGFTFHRLDGRGLVSGISWEHVYTMQQGQRKGRETHRDSYYNNGLYKSGWTYEGRTLGIPLLFSDGTRVVNNLVVAHHFALQGALHPRARYRLLFTYSRNYGAGYQPNPVRLNQYSALVETGVRPFRRWPLQLMLAVAHDRGAVYPEQWGGQLGLRWGGTALR